MLVYAKHSSGENLRVHNRRGGGYKEGYSEENILPADVSTAENRLGLSIIVSKVNKEKFTVIESSQHSAWCMWKAL